ncbi:helix-turn-helix transcriptional regulator [Hymenobacter sp. YC55]|uniref:helix-turn-helix domain-containing protein n=1 Tax=Hymenobacter sp. YC55 TaxID=3034019 RepID=UPI0023F7E1EB|nr:helix-turn-helix transcriptional regulator [Hymenobacter sp. YC55]MDF7811841.1 helix-turn-helix transcriptional regulator [Hymenobacter sp. YC55]
MVERIREILSVRQLTPTQFADTIGVARPIVSHILSGRNKPSLEVVQKIIAAFPDLSLSWLLSGNGPMEASNLATGAVDASSEEQPSRRVSTKASETARPASNKAKAQPDKVEFTVSTPGALNERGTPPIYANASASETPSLPLFPTPTAVASENSQSAATPSVTAQVPPVQQESDVHNQVVATKPVAVAAVPATAATTTSAPSAAQPFVEPGKAIRRIVIFYQDGTFTDYQPDNK